MHGSSGFRCCGSFCSAERAPDVSTQGSAFDQELNVLAADIKRLEADYNMFFAGRLPRLPWESRARVTALIKRYDNTSIRNTAERFRFSTLQSRFAALCELWDRALKAREEGRVPAVRRSGARSISPPAPSSPEPARTGSPRSDATPTSTPIPRPVSEQVVAVATFRDPGREAERLQELYQRLADARREAGEPPLPYQRVADVVRAQVNKLGSGGNEVAFRVAVKDGKVTLTAKAIKSE